MKNLQQFWNTNKVFIIGLLMAVSTSVYEIVSKGSDFNWWVIGWSTFVAALTYAGKNLRGQWASIATTVATTVAAFYTLHNTAEGVDIKTIITNLLLPFLIQVLGVLYTTPPKLREYEHTAPIVSAKEEAKVIKDEKTSS